VERVPEQATAIAERIFAAAQSRAVWGDPVHAEGYTVIPASEVMAGGGFGYGFGIGRSPGVSSRVASQDGDNEGSGGGSGGGGGALGRPVATIIIGPDGVRVRPVVDVTRIALAAVTTWAAMAMTIMSLRRVGRIFRR